MNKQQAIDLVRGTFESPFEKKRFGEFIGNLLNEYDRGEFTYTGKYIPDSYKDYVNKYERLGKYEDSEEKRIDILIVYLKRETAIERARSMQRNFVAGYLLGKYGTDADKDAALVAFVAPNGEDWRFSLVKLEVKLEANDKGGMKVVDEFTPAKRWSFLVGSHEKSHTAQTQFVPIMQDTDNNPTLAKLEEAFNIEKVTKEFFEKYRELFIRTKEALDKAVKANPATRSDFERKSINTVDLAKKLLGQIIFLYYLQKKGWFGVPKEKKWGDGSKNFLRELFTKSQNEKKNFFNDILEPLFYEALRIDRSHDDHYYKLFDCKIPFLNGGLFDPMNNYDWVKTEILLSNTLFSHKTKDDPEGDGILDVFDLYNFTVKEDEPFEKEVAIDPELLGKAYEKFNAIRPDNYDEFLKALKSGKKGEESKFNKQYGVYYTPREIVHYMCQQSLINYLYSELNPNVVYQSLGDDQLDMFGNAAKGGQMDKSVEHRPMAEIAKEEIALLIQHGESWRENEERVETTGKETVAYSYKTPESIRENAALIDEKLAAIKVCDPAVGSGAFPVGMMSEIVRARDVLKTWTKSKKTVYDFKRQCIENSLYGVDIDAGAVEIAKLRLWLSLIVDEDDIQNIKPLPNLDYKIVCGNSLVGFPDNWGSPIEKEIEALIHQHFNETRVAKKNELKTKIDEKIESRYKNSLRAFGYQVNFDFRTVFSVVFQQNGGFDVIIANPPYVLGRNTFTKELKQYISRNYDVFGGKYDLYIYFTEKAISLLKPGATVIYIIPNTILANENAIKLRKLILNKTQLNIIRAFDKMVFSDAQVESVIIEVSKKPTSRDAVVVQIGENKLEVNQDVFSNNKDFRFNIYSTSTTESLINKMVSQSELLGNLSDICIGIQLGGSSGSDTKESFLSTTEKNETYKKVLDGKDINYYSTVWGGEYVRYGNWLHRKRDEKYFLNPKIMIRQIGSVPVATYDEGKYYTLNTIYNLINLSEYSLKYLLVIINSKLGKWFWRSQNSDFKTLFPKIKKTQIESIPVRQINFSNSLDKRLHDNLVSFVDRILAAKRANPQADTSKLESEIDELVYKLYGLTDEEIAIVKGR